MKRATSAQCDWCREWPGVRGKSPWRVLLSPGALREFSAPVSSVSEFHFTTTFLRWS